MPFTYPYSYHIHSLAFHLPFTFSLFYHSLALHSLKVQAGAVDNQLLLGAAYFNASEGASEGQDAQPQGGGEGGEQRTLSPAYYDDGPPADALKLFLRGTCSALSR